MIADDSYEGPATVRIAGDHGAEVVLEATAALRGYFEPIDGRFHWYGRLSADETLTRIVGMGKAPARLSTPHGEAEATLSDLDPWGRLRAAGVGTPPFPVE